MLRSVAVFIVFLVTASAAAMMLLGACACLPILLLGALVLGGLAAEYWAPVWRARSSRRSDGQRLNADQRLGADQRLNAEMRAGAAAPR